MFISFSGLDGAGKTTQIKKLREFLKREGQPVKLLVMYGNISSSAVMRRFVRKKLRKMSKDIASDTPGVSKGTPRGCPREVSEGTYRCDKNRKDPYLVVLRQIIYIVDLVMFSVKRFYYETVKGKIVVADRYLYDSLANLEGTGRWSKGYVKLMLKIIPQPDMAFLINADPQAAFERKPEYPPEYYFERQKAYLAIFKQLSQGFIIAPDTIEATADTIRYFVRQQIPNGSAVAFQGDKYAFFVTHILKTLFGVNDLGAEIRYLYKTPNDVEYMKQVLNKNITSVRYIERLNTAADRKIQDAFRPILENKFNRMKEGCVIIGRITEIFEKENIPVVCMKTIDNYPDIGHDIDFYTDAPLETADRIITKHFHVRGARQSFSDKLAAKKSYKIEDYPGVEMHCGKLGQVGEENVISKALIAGRQKYEIEGITTYIPRPEHSLSIRVLQRMYRHFNIRVTDVYNTVRMIEKGDMDWDYLKKIAQQAGIWQGVIAYLNEINRIYHFHTGKLLAIPIDGVNHAAGVVSSRRMLFRFPLVSVGAMLYLKKILADLGNHNFYSFCRSNMIVPLAITNLLLIKLFKKEVIW